MGRGIGKHPLPTPHAAALPADCGPVFRRDDERGASGRLIDINVSICHFYRVDYIESSLGQAEAWAGGPNAADNGTDSFADLPLLDARRPKLRYRPLKAWRHFRNLVKNKEDTEQVFRIFESLPWKGMPDAAKAFLGSPKGQAIMASEPRLPEILDDHAALRRLPSGSVAHAYCDFMEREGLSAQGLVDEFARFLRDRPAYEDQFALYLDRIRDTHDLLHILTGYGRDALGEQCVLAFSYSQQPSLGNLFIAYAGGIEILRSVKRGAPVMRAIREGQRLGRACPRVAELPVRQVLALPLEEARAWLNISPPRHYHECHAIWQSRGIDPYAILKPQAG